MPAGRAEALPREIPDLDLDHAWDLAPERASSWRAKCEAAAPGCRLPRINQLRGRNP